MEQKKQEIQAADVRQLKKKLIIAAVLTVVLVVGGIVGVLISAYGGQGNIKGLLELYYETMYRDNGKGLDTLADCMAPEAQKDYYNVLTYGGTNFTQLNVWRNEATSTVGDNVKVTVRLGEQREGSDEELSVIRATYASAERLRSAIFYITVEGDRGYVKLQGVAECIRAGNKWYLTGDKITLTPYERVIDGVVEKVEE